MEIFGEGVEEEEEDLLHIAIAICSFLISYPTVYTDQELGFRNGEGARRFKLICSITWPALV